jgi:hypothetical protein
MELLTKQLREPAGAGHGVFGFCGQVLFLQATEPSLTGAPVASWMAWRIWSFLMRAK